MEGLAGVLKSVHVLHDRVLRAGRRRVPEQAGEGAVPADVVAVEGIGTEADVVKPAAQGSGQRSAWSRTVAA
jgi:hypothetical protein